MILSNFENILFSKKKVFKVECNFYRKTWEVLNHRMKTTCLPESGHCAVGGLFFCLPRLAFTAETLGCLACLHHLLCLSGLCLSFVSSPSPLGFSQRLNSESSLFNEPIAPWASQHGFFFAHKYLPLAYCLVSHNYQRLVDFYFSQEWLHHWEK